MQVSRLGMPLVDEIVLPLEQKDRWNASRPADDGQFLNFVIDPEPGRLLVLLYGLKLPPTRRNWNAVLGTRTVESSTAAFISMWPP